VTPYGWCPKSPRAAAMLDVSESRYDRQERIWWWDQTRLLSSRVLVVGAGALGNEIVKNLVLTGVGVIDVVDMDTIEHSNLSRCAFFTDADQGRHKAEVLVEGATALNPDVTLRAFTVPIQALGSGWVKQYDLVIAGLDNREARMWLNSACRRLGMFWIDGAIEGLQGLARVFGPDGPCYECTLSEADLANLGHRRSCALLKPEDLAMGRTPTNATSSSVVAGVEVQEGIKLLVGRPDLCSLIGKVWRFEGESMLTSVVEYVANPDCMAHDEVGELSVLAALPATLAAAAAEVSALLGENVVAIDLAEDLMHVESCPTCGEGSALLGLRSVLPLGAGVCAACGAERPMTARSSLTPDHVWATTPLESIGWTQSELVGFRTEFRSTHVILSEAS